MWKLHLYDDGSDNKNILLTRHIFLYLPLTLLEYYFTYLIFHLQLSNVVLLVKKKRYTNFKNNLY